MTTMRSRSGSAWIAWCRYPSRSRLSSRSSGPSDCSGTISSAAPVGKALEAEQRRLLHVLLHRGQLRDADAEHLGHLGLGGRTAQRGHQLLRAWALRRARARTDAAGPVLPAQLVQQRAADPDGREAVERDAPGDIERTRGAEQRGESRGRQVVGVHVAGNAVEQLPDQMADHRHVFADEVLEVARGRRVVGGADGGGEFGVVVTVSSSLVRPGRVTG